MNIIWIQYLSLLLLSLLWKFCGDCKIFIIMLRLYWSMRLFISRQVSYYWDVISIFYLLLGIKLQFELGIFCFLILRVPLILFILFYLFSCYLNQIFEFSFLLEHVMEKGLLDDLSVRVVIFFFVILIFVCHSHLKICPLPFNTYYLL